jgi:hypothetical protein
MWAASLPAEAGRGNRTRAVGLYRRTGSGPRWMTQPADRRPGPERPATGHLLSGPPAADLEPTHHAAYRQPLLKPVLGMAPS